MSRTPKKIVAALTACGAKVGAIELREFTIGTVMVLEKIDSPFLTNESNKPLQLTNLEILRLVFALSRKPSESFLILRNGLAAYDEAVVDFADGIAPQMLPELGERIRELFAKAMSTAPEGDVSDAKKKMGQPPTHLPISPSPAANTAGS